MEGCCWFMKTSKVAVKDSTDHIQDTRRYASLLFRGHQNVLLYLDHLQQESWGGVPNNTLKPKPGEDNVDF